MRMLSWPWGSCDVNALFEVGPLLCDENVE